VLSPLPAFALALFLLGPITSESSAQDAPGPSAAGAGTVSLADGLKRRFEFKVVTQEDGGVSGYVTLSDPSEIADQDVDGTGEPGLEGAPDVVELTVEVYSMSVEGKRAVLSGVVTSTNHLRYADVRVILTVEDNGEGGEAGRPDRITWGIYRKEDERHVTDAENPDAGIYPTGGREFDSRRFPLSAYSLSAIGEGDIQVRP